jgi:hypothetical protein
MKTRNANFGMKANGMRKAMNKRALALMVAILLSAGPAMAQIFLDDEEMTARGWLGEVDDIGNIVPFHEVEWDQANYVPLGGEVMLLAALGGAYLLGKRHRKED